jgi:cytochrome P450
MARRDPLGFFLECRRRYGDVVSMRFGARRLCLLSHPDHVKQVLQDNHLAYGKSAPASRVRPLFGDSLTTVDGDRWRRERRCLQPAFQQLERFVPIVIEATAEMLDRWRPRAAAAGTLDLAAEMTGLMRGITLRVLFGDLPEGEAQALGRALETTVQHVDRHLWSLLGERTLLTPGRNRFTLALRAIAAFVAEKVDQARRGRAGSGTLLSALADAHEAQRASGGTTTDLRDELQALLIAGHTTTSSALTWAWLLLSANPSARGGLQQELRAVLDGRGPTAADLPLLPYTRAVLEEVLRLYPPTWLTARMLLDDDHIGGYRIPAGTIVLLSPFVTQRDPRFWEDPERFDPTRFTREHAPARPRFAYFPFGGGPRHCIGSELASAEMRLVVAMVAQHYELTPVPGLRLEPAVGLTLKPLHATFRVSEWSP